MEENDLAIGVMARLKRVLAKLVGKETKEITVEKKLVEDLGIKASVFFEMIRGLEYEFDIEIDINNFIREVVLVRDILSYIARRELVPGVHSSES